MKAAILLSLASATLSAQTLVVYSEFVRIDADGEVKAPESPREILSPAVARNAFTSFQVVVQATGSKTWWLHVGQNPENAADVTMYRESGDKLEKVELPVRGQGNQVFWMDLWTARSAPVQRIKVEPQLNIDDDWIIYPMEVRVMDATVPDGPWPGGAASPSEVMRQFVCEGSGSTGKGSPAPAQVSAAKLRYRNAQQDLALAAKAPRGELQKLAGCGAPLSSNPESYYPVRDYLFRMR
jgi:hypothetical protein